MRHGIFSLGAFLLIGCVDLHADRRVIVDHPFTISEAPHIVHPERPLRAIGPFNELCLQLPAEYQLGSGDHGPNMWKVRRPDGTFVTPEVVVIYASGHREPVPFTHFLSTSEICFETRPERDLKRRYDRVELRADDSLQVLKLRWHAGHRYTWL